MSAPRLLFLYPPLYRSFQAPEGTTALRRVVKAKSDSNCKGFHNTVKRRQETYSQRYGPAAEQAPPPLASGAGMSKPTLPGTGDKPSPPARKEEEKKARDSSPKEATESLQRSPQHAETPSKSPVASPKKASSPAELEAEASRLKEISISSKQDRASKPLETVLHLEPPISATKEEHKPHLHAPPYVHHFDAYSLVKDLEKGDFTQDQSVSLMKAVRGLLAVNLELAREGLVSKSDVANETYLFRAACSELRIEIQNARKASSEKMRSERAHLQHEVDILSQKLTQDLLTLKDELKGMFDDRKMAVRMEQRAMDGAIQQLNYKIAVALNSDSKGEVEGLRWVLTRRAAMAIGGMAFLILGSLRYSSYMMHLQDQERKRMASLGSSTSTGTGTGGGAGGTYTVQSRDTGTQTDSQTQPGGEASAMLASMESGTSPAYVSLG